MISRCLLLLITVTYAAGAGATTVNSYIHNRRGLKELEKKQYYPAYREFMHALEDDPLNPAVQMNLGHTFEANEEFEKAEGAYRGVYKLAPRGSDLEFHALFNLAGVLGREQKIDEALATYQKCLDLKPDSIEVKTNIELLWQGGQGGGKGGQNKDQKQQGDNQQQQKQDPGQQKEEQKKQPKPFNSQDLSKEDVKRILDEIKNQEQAIRAQENDKNAKEAPRDKDW